MIASTALLAFAADKLVEAASRIGRRLGISEVVIGLTIVAFGTSAPELAVTVGAALEGRGDISVGNVVGSNVFNLGIVLGFAGLLRSLATDAALVRRDGAFLLFAVTVLLVLTWSDLQIGRLDGILLLTLLVLYLLHLYRSTRFERREARAANKGTVEGSPLADAVWLLSGLAGVVIGAKLLVAGATDVARALGMSEWVIGVTIVAAGTSAPEFATAVVAAIKGRHGISVGGLIGSDIFNVLCVLGAAGIINPVTVSPVARYSIIGFILTVALVIAFMRTGWRISRLEGGLLIAVAIGRWIFDISMQQ